MGHETLGVIFFSSLSLTTNDKRKENQRKILTTNQTLKKTLRKLGGKTNEICFSLELEIKELNTRKNKIDFNKKTR